MVLLTSSTISVVISSSIVCTFTFLLFLSGYVLQQQTVRSLQEALRAPPPPKPTPTLPPQFQKLQAESVIAGNGEVRLEVVEVVVSASNTRDGPAKGEQAALQKSLFVAPQADKSPQIGDNEAETLTTMVSSTDRPLPGSQVDQVDLPKAAPRLAYILTLPHTSALCSALLFAKWQREFSSLTPKPNIVFLYPANWESSNTPSHNSAISLLREAQDQYAIIYHPVQINPIWTGVDINAQLLGEMQRNRWDYDRAIYLRSPGILLDAGALDKALLSSNLKTSWTRLTATSPDIDVLNPDILLLSTTRGMLIPRGDMRQLTAYAVTSHADHHETEMDVDAAARNAAYVLFDEAELEHRRDEKEWSGGVFERFERERRRVCAATSLLDGVHGAEREPERKTSKARGW